MLVASGEKYHNGKSPIDSDLSEMSRFSGNIMSRMEQHAYEKRCATNTTTNDI